MFLQLTKEQGSTLTRRMHARFERRQRTRLKRAIEMLDRDLRSGLRSGESKVEAAPLARLQLRAGQLVYAQGEPASSFYIVSRGELQARPTPPTPNPSPGPNPSPNPSPNPNPSPPNPSPSPDQAVFTSSSGEHATLRSYTAGDQFGYDAMLS